MSHSLSPLPWHADDHAGTGKPRVLWDAKGHYVAQVEKPGLPDVTDANAARIVACVNACAGMADPAHALALARAALKRAAYSLKVHGAKDVDVQCAEALRALGGT